MAGMGPIADAPQAVQSRNSETGGEVSVGAPSHGSFAQAPSQFPGDECGLLVKSGDPRGAFHRRTVHAAGDRELASVIERPKRTQLAVDAGRVFYAGDADI